MSKTVFACIALATLVGHWEIYNQRRISDLDTLCKVSLQKEAIAYDQVRELISNLQTANISNESMKTQGYVAGIVDGINRANTKETDRPEYMAIWHNGYDRGTANQAMMVNYKPSLLDSSDQPEKNEE